MKKNWVYRILSKNKAKKSLFVLVFTVLTTSVLGHGIWIEIVNKGPVGKEATVHLYFGEINHGVKEKGMKWYGGDMFKDYKAVVKPHGTTVGKTLTLSASETSMLAKFTPKVPGIYQIVALNEDSPVRDLTKHGMGMLKDISYLRTTFEATSRRQKQEGRIDLSPMVKYDIVPFPAKNGYGEYDSHRSTWRVNERVYATFYVDFKPAADQEIKITSPDGWSVTRKTNKEGEFNFTPYKKGVYLATYQSKKKVGGTFNGKKYDMSRIKATVLLHVE